MQDFAARRAMMVDTQVRPNDVTKLPIIAAMLDVPREEFIPAAKREAAYIGENLRLSHDRWLLDPRTFAKMLDAIDVRPSDLVLDIGCGQGYSSAVIARMAEAVVAVDEDELASLAEATLARLGTDNVAVTAAPLSQGDSQHGPYDAIVIEGGVEFIPLAITEQLKDGGRIVAVFMLGALGVVRLGRKIDGTLMWRDIFNASAPVLSGFAQKKEFAL